MTDRASAARAAWGHNHEFHRNLRSNQRCGRSPFLTGDYFVKDRGLFFKAFYPARG